MYDIFIFVRLELVLDDLFKLVYSRHYLFKKYNHRDTQYVILDVFSEGHPQQRRSWKKGVLTKEGWHSLFWPRGASAAAGVECRVLEDPRTVHTKVLGYLLYLKVALVYGKNLFGHFLPWTKPTPPQPHDETQSTENLQQTFFIWGYYSEGECPLEATVG